MKDIIKLAWRNIWRNKRRTIITIASIFSALIFALIMVSLQIGSYAQMMRSMLDNYTGYVQIYKTGYFEDRTIDNSFIEPGNLIGKIDKIPNVKAAIPHIESFALAFAGQQSKGVIVLGIDPEREKKFSNPETKLIRGKYFIDNEGGLIISERLAAFLKTNIGDTLTLMGQGYHGASSAGLFAVRGIIRLPNPDLDRRIIYMDLNSARNFYQTEGMLTSLVLNLHDKDKTEETRSEIRRLLQTSTNNPGDFDVLTYIENSPELIQQIESDRASGYIFISILYLIVGFGVLGTVLMMISERRKEFGVMVAIGMQKIKLSAIVVIEMLFISILGIISAIIGSIPIVLILHYHPIRFSGELAKVYEGYGFEPTMPADLNLQVYLQQSSFVLIIILLAIALPVYNITRLKEIQALKK